MLSRKTVIGATLKFQASQFSGDNYLEAFHCPAD
jgi:hypothetical protein